MDYFDLGDVLPDEIHTVVPRPFRSKTPDDVVVHTADLAADDVHHEGVLRRTNPLRTLLDVVAEAYPDDQLSLIRQQSFARGLVRRRDLDPATPKVRTYLDRLTKARARRVSAWLARAAREV